MYLEKPAYVRPPDEPSRPHLDRQLDQFGSYPECQGWLRCVLSETTVDLAYQWIAGFQRFHPEIRIDVFVGGSQAVAPALADGWADLAIVSRELAPAESAQFERVKQYPPRRVEVGGGSFRTVGYTDTTVVIVNESNPATGVSVAQLGRVLGPPADPSASAPTWGDLGLDGSWADKKINVVVPNPDNGFGFFVRERVLHGATFRPGIAVKDRVSPITPAVAADPAALGIIGLGHLGRGVKTLAVAAGDGTSFVEPTLDAVARRDYPLARSIYVMVDQPPGTALARPIELFLRYLFSREGQQDLLEHGVFLPLPATVAEREISSL